MSNRIIAGSAIQKKINDTEKIKGKIAGTINQKNSKNTVLEGQLIRFRRLGIAYPAFHTGKDREFRIIPAKFISKPVNRAFDPPRILRTFTNYQPGHRSSLRRGEESPDSIGQCTG